MVSKNSIYVLYDNGLLKLFNTTSIAGSGENAHITVSNFEFKDHFGHSAYFGSNWNGEWIYTYSDDGMVTLRSIVQPDHAVKILAHDSETGGVFTGGFSFDFRHFFTIGYDGLMRKWDWKISASGRRAAVEMFEAIDAEPNELSAEATAFLESLTVIRDIEDSSEEPWIPAGIESAGEDVNTLGNERDVFRNHIQTKITLISEKIVDLMRKNDAAPAIEKLDRSEFVIDIQMKERLLLDTDNEIDAIKKAQERKNWGKRVLSSRIRKECWDSSEVVGQSIKSFKMNPSLDSILEVTNYPIRRPTANEAQIQLSVKRLRRVQLALNQALNKSADLVEIPMAEAAEEISAEDARKKLLNTKNAKYLYHPFELTTKEKRRMQAFLLADTAIDVKMNFNQQFTDMVKVKLDEIAKIEEKNERILSILSQLQLNEKIYHPDLDEDEIPESVIKVLDSEVTVERFLSTEELAKLDAKRLAAARSKQQGEDNARQRALIDMMNGKLEDRKANEEKEEIVRPEWMNKPKDDMSEEEKKQLKEFEKKMAIFKEEHEKQRKALETELRKLQVAISDIQDVFDEKLREFSIQKLEVDYIIYEKELTMVKQTQFAISSNYDDKLEAELVQKIDNLKQEKINCSNEIPEIKKELEKAREDYDSASKRDKEMEKAFKKDFGAYESYYEALFRLFKKRNTPSNTSEKDGNDEDLNPFSAFEKEIALNDWSPIALNQATDMPDGLSIELWNRLVDIRDKKIGTEQEVVQAAKYLKEMQALVQNVLEESDTIKMEMEKAMNDLSQFLDYKFRNIYNIESLFHFKQGQVEVPQAPIVTNYSDGVLIHKSVVETLNEQVKHLGQLKVEALTEMKNYRKGIHALEWFEISIKF